MFVWFVGRLSIVFNVFNSEIVLLSLIDLSCFILCNSGF